MGSQPHHPPTAFSVFHPPSGKSMPALLVFLPFLVKALRRREQTSGMLVRPWPAMCDASWELFLFFHFRMEYLLRADRTGRSPSHSKTSTKDLQSTSLPVHHEVGFRKRAWHTLN